jgi:hypothetical protein
MVKYVPPSAPLSMGGVLDNWLSLFRSSLGACWAVALLAAAAGALVQLTITPSVPTTQLPAYQAYLQYLSALRGPRIILTDIAFGLLTLLVYGALLTQQAALVRGEEPFSFGTALAKGLGRVPQILLGTVLLVLIVMAVCIPGGIAAAVFIALRHEPLAIFFAALFAAALIAVLIYVTVRLQLWLAAMFIENCGAATSLGRSWDLVKGHWWRVTGLGFVSGIVIWILTMVIGAVIGFGVGLVGIHGTGPDLLARRLQLIGAVSEVVRLLTMPLLTAAWLAIYHDLTLRREGGDLAARAEALGGR